jgi:starch phosphorylase
MVANTNCPQIGEENIFLFGNLAEDVEDIRHQHTYQGVLLDESLEKVFDTIHQGTFGSVDEFRALTSTVINHDHWLVSADFASYVKTQESIDEVFKDQEEWIRKTIVSVSRMGFFSSDRCIEEYAEGKFKISSFTSCHLLIVWF